ncbi:MAG: hypothetical protein KF814_10610 [Nitrospiraceae bacterium]|nr:hypothetical protein [Nitrospiraceae bacterium]
MVRLLDDSRLGRLALCIWVCVWMLLVPLFHVHPEADHHHGEAGHVHGGTVHTVWSGDLDCESDRYERPSPGVVTLSSDGSPSWHEHPELGFSVLNDSTDRKPLKPCITVGVLLSSIEFDGLVRGRVLFDDPVPPAKPWRLLTHAHSAHAPPVSLS